MKASVIHKPKLETAKIAQTIGATRKPLKV
jgi:hypothetical protein